MSLTNLIKEAHSQGKIYADRSAKEVLSNIETHPETMGLYLYAGTPMPVSYLEGFFGYFVKKRKTI